MFLTYLRRELTRRSKQTLFIAFGLAVAIGLVMVVNGAAGGIKTAQDKVLSNLYGIGTDVSITKTDTSFSGGPHQFDVGGKTGGTGTQAFSRSFLTVQPGTGTLTSAYVQKVSAVAGVSQVVSTLKLDSLNFSGQLPTFNQSTGSSTTGSTPIGGSTSLNQGGQQAQGTQSRTQQGTETGSQPAPTFGGGQGRGGFDGNGGSRFNINRMTVEGISTAAGANKIGPLSTVVVTSGRALKPADAGSDVAVLDSTYASGAALKLGSTLTISATKFTVVGIAKSTSTAATTSSNAYIPLDVAQTLSGKTGAVTNVYVSAKSADVIPSLKTAIKKLDSVATVNTSSDLASTVTGSLSTASSVVNNVGTWLSMAVLAGAFWIAILFTMSGVTRRTREFGTLKALGWKSSRVVRQVIGESLVTSILGGIFGIVLGYGGIALVNALSPSLSGSLQAATGFGGGDRGGFGGPPGIRQTTASVVNVALNASVSPNILVLAFAFALLGGLLAGVFGGFRAAKLSPAQALRSVA